MRPMRPISPMSLISPTSNMKLLTTLITCCLAAILHAQTINLAGTWQFAIDRNDRGLSEQWYNRQLDDTIELPASMPQRLKGDDISVNTHWVGSLYDSSYFYNPYMAKYRKPGKDMKLTFFLTPDKHYVGVAWYQRTVDLPTYDKNGTYTLYLERPHIETTLFVNGKRVGMRNSLVVAHQYDVSQYLHSGTNTISIRIDNRPETVNVGQDSHSITDQTQGDWNGIVGRMELQKTSATHITDLQVYPDIDKQEALVKLQVVGKPKSKYKLTLHASNNEIEAGFSEGVRETTITLTADTTWFEYPVALKNMKLWDEFHPNTYTLTALLSVKKNTVDMIGTTFGMRKFEIRGKMFYVNGHEVQLRGTVENCDFPLTGYAPMDVESWMKVFNRCKAYGLNHMRFHSYCPPEAAFIAADKVGFYLQPEGPSWPNHGVALGNGRPIDTYLMEETIRMAKDYGNHPSFCMLACGNEPAGRWVDWVGKFVDYWKATDNRRVYTGASVGGSWQWQPKSQYHVKAGARGLQWGNRRPDTMDDYTSAIGQVAEPYVSHETGQWCVFPNFEEIGKYTGVNKARNFEVFRDILNDNGMGSRAKQFMMASGKLQAICYKYEIERTMRTPQYAGFQLLALNDYSGQGTALVGVTDVFFDDKGYMTAPEFRAFCSPIVPLAKMPKFTYSNSETFHADIVLNQYADHTLLNIRPTYTITSGDKTLHVGHFPAQDWKIGNNIPVGSIDYPLASIREAQKLTLTVSLPGTEAKNQWDFWVYPADTKAEVGDVWVTDQFDEKAQSVLKKGGKVLLTAAGKISYGKEVVQQFTPVFWNTSWFKMRPPHTTGILVENTHSIFDLFPTDYHSDLQWWELVNKAQVMQFTDFPADFQPLVQSIDTWFLSRKIGMLFEANVLGGKLIMTTMDITSNLNQRLAAHQMRASILHYMNSDQFKPAFTIEPQLISDLFTKVAPPVNSFTNDSPDELKPKNN